MKRNIKWHYIENIYIIELIYMYNIINIHININLYAKNVEIKTKLTQS